MAGRSRASQGSRVYRLTSVRTGPPGGLWCHSITRAPSSRHQISVLAAVGSSPSAEITSRSPTQSVRYSQCPVRILNISVGPPSRRYTRRSAGDRPSTSSSASTVCVTTQVSRRSAVPPPVGRAAMIRQVPVKSGRAVLAPRLATRASDPMTARASGCMTWPHNRSHT